MKAMWEKKFSTINIIKKENSHKIKVYETLNKNGIKNLIFIILTVFSVVKLYETEWGK
jgi:hypothetical protein